MADVAVGQQTEASNAAAATTLVINITPAAAGSSLHLPITCGGGFTVSSVASSPSLTWTQRNAVDDGNQALCDWTADGVTAAAHTITITFSGSAPYRGAFAKEIVNTSGYDAAASAAHAAAVTASPGTGADGITTGNTSALSAQPALISAATIPTNTVALATAGTGFTSDGVGWSFGGNTGTSESKRVTATTALAATFTAPSNVPFDSVASVFLELTGGGAATATTFTGPSTGVDDVQSTDFTVGANGTITGTVTCTFTNSLSGTWSFATRDISSGTPTQTVKYTPSVPGTHVLGVTDNGGLTDATSINYVVASVSRPSSVTPNTWTDEAGGALVVADINDNSDSTGAKDPAGASYPVLAFTMDTPMAASVSQTCYFRGNNVAAGKQARQVLFANDGTTVVATGAWKTMTGSLATYSDSLTPTATAYKGEIQTQAVPGLMTYSTTFSGTENPISESGVWTNGGSVGLDWKNVQTNGSIAHASATSPTYDDCCAHLSGFDPVSHYAQATIYKAGGYAPTDNHEVELLVAATITANSIYLYEFLWSVAGAVQFVRWDGGMGTIDTGAVTVRGLDTGIGSPADGDVIKLTFGISGGNPIMDLYVNGVLKKEMTDTTAGKLSSGGQPGMSFFVRSGDTTLTSYGFTDFSASDI